MIEVNVTSTNYIVTATETVNNITVTSDNTLFTVTSAISNFTVTNVNSIITFDTEGFDFDFATKHLGEWVNGNVYTRNDVVRYENSIYICSIPFNTTLTSTTPPPNDPTNWELFYWNQWTKQYLTITNFLDVGGPVSVGGSMTVAGATTISNKLTVNGPLEVSSTATFNGALQANGSFTGINGTFTNLNVGNQFTINYLNYPIDRGVYGQILMTNGANLATWVNISDLIFWNLSSDLQTNGFNIVTGKEEAVPNPQLTIGSGETGDFESLIRFNTGGTQIRIYAPNEVSIEGDNATDILVQGDTGDLRLRADNGSGNISLIGNVRVDGDVTGPNSYDPVRVGSGGIRFSDGTVQTSASTGTGFTVTQIASTTTLGVIRVGQYLTINSSTGVLSVDPDPAWTYTLPAASTSTRGGIRVGNGLVISEGDVLNVSTSSAFGNVSLTEDMLTNGYKVKYDDDSYVDINNNDIDITSDNVNINGTNISIDSVNNLQLLAPITILGDDIYNTRLHVGRIYNFSGVGPPLFPAGIQFDDQTVQITAYDDGRFDNGNLDQLPYFTNSSWQKLITYLINIDFLDPNVVWTEEDLG